MRYLLWIMLLFAIAGCGTALPTEMPTAPMPSPIPDALKPENVRKVGPALRRHLLQRGQQVLEAQQSLDAQLESVTVIIQARRDISDELEKRSAAVRSVTPDGIYVITADVPLNAIPALLTLPDLEAIELTQPVSPAVPEPNENGIRRMDDGG